MWQIFLLAGIVFASLGIIELKKEKGTRMPKIKRIGQKSWRESLKMLNLLKRKEKDKEEMLPEVSVQGAKYSFKPLNSGEKKQEKKVQYIKLRLVEENEIKKKQEQAKQRLKILQNMEEEAKKKEEKEKFEQMKRENIERERQKRWKEHYIIKAVKERFGGEEKEEKEKEDGPKGIFGSLLSQRQGSIEKREEVENDDNIEKKEEMPQYEQYNPFSPDTSPSMPLAESKIEKGERKQENLLPFPSSLPTAIESKESEDINDAQKDEGEEEKKEDMLSFFANRARENKKEFDPSEMFKEI